MSSADDPPAARRSFWTPVGTGLRSVGRATAAGLALAGNAAKKAYLAVDPDLRRQLAETPFVGLTMFVPRELGVEALPDDGHRPIVMVHGLGGHPGNLFPLKTYLRLIGRKRVYSVSFPRGLDLDEMAAHLRGVVLAVIEKNTLRDGRSVDLIAHSMGGIVARLALEDESFASRVATLLTLGTPHAGSYLARFLQTEKTLALRPGSPLYARLEAQLPWRGPPHSPRLVAFWSSADTILLPHASALLPGAENVELRGVTHLGYLIRPVVWQRVAQELAATAPAP